MKKSLLIALVLLMITATAVMAAGTKVEFKGQGWVYDGEVYNIIDERCDVDAEANDGGTGLFADWNKPGAYETGQGYLLWVLSANGATSAKLYLPDGLTVDMIKVGGTFKWASEYYPYTKLIQQEPPFTVYAEYEGKVKGNVNLVVSHGCKPFTGEGAWCSPGFWLNTLKKTPNAWATIGVTPPGPYYNDVITTPGATGTPTLLDVLMDKSMYFDPNYQGAGFNAVGAYLTDLIPGFYFDPGRMDVKDDTSCPLDAFGRFKKDIPQE